MLIWLTIKLNYVPGLSHFHGKFFFPGRAKPQDISMLCSGKGDASPETLYYRANSYMGTRTQPEHVEQVLRSTIATRRYIVRTEFPRLRCWPPVPHRNAQILLIYNIPALCQGSMVDQVYPAFASIAHFGGIFTTREPKKTSLPTHTHTPSPLCSHPFRKSNRWIRPSRIIRKCQVYSINVMKETTKHADIIYKTNLNALFLYCTFMLNTINTR